MNAGGGHLTRMNPDRLTNRTFALLLQKKPGEAWFCEIVKDAQKVWDKSRRFQKAGYA